MPQLLADQLVLGAHANLLVDRIDEDLRLVSVSGSEAFDLGFGFGELEGRSASEIYDEASLARLLPLLKKQSTRPVCLPVTLRKSDGSTLNLLAFAVPGLDENGSVLDVFKGDSLDLGAELDSVRETNDVMWGIIQMAREAIWCIRYDEPVDVTQSLERIVDQIFENSCVWSLCNRAMARAYDLPDEMDLSSRSVRFHWPRNEMNEAFVRDVIAHDFRVDGAISQDYRHDGTAVLVENDVRAHIIAGRLHRLWGTLREIERADHSAASEPSVTSLGFEGLPVPGAVISADGRLLAANNLWLEQLTQNHQTPESVIFRTLNPNRRSRRRKGLVGPVVLLLAGSDGVALPYTVQGCWHGKDEKGQPLLIVTAAPVLGGDAA